MKGDAVGDRRSALRFYHAAHCACGSGEGVCFHAEILQHTQVEIGKGVVVRLGEG